MTSTGHRTDRDPPILAAVSSIGAELDAVEHAPAWSPSDEETRRGMVGDASGATSAGVWWANHTRMVQRDAHRRMRLAKALERHEPVGEAFAAGEVLVDQAQVIIDAIDALPDDVDADIRVQARDHLLVQARDFDAKALRIAMLVREQTCVTRGCERPASACHAHHLTASPAWAEGGHTTVKKGALLCRRHHTLAHHADYQLTRHPDGTITFTRRE